MDDASLQQLLKSVEGGTSSSTSGSLFNIDTIMKSLTPYIIALTAVSILITILYLISVVNKWRVNKAILDMKKLLIEMNERDKMRGNPAVITESPIPHTAPTDTTLPS
jgi:hypothetical protein